MSVSTAIVVNLVLDAAVLTALAVVCRVPFRIGSRGGIRTPAAARVAKARQRQVA